MSADRYEKVKRNTNFQTLVRSRSKWAWGLATLILLMYFSFILLIAYAPHWLAQPLVAGSVITIGIPIGVVVILVAFLLTGVYVHKANTDFDRINQKILSEIEQ